MSTTHLYGTVRQTSFISTPRYSGSKHWRNEIRHVLALRRSSLVSAPPPFLFDHMARAGYRECLAKASVPIEHGATGVEGQCLDIRQAHGISTVAPNVLPDSMASCALTASFSAYS